MNLRIVINDNDIARSKEYAARMIAGYAAGRSEASRAVSSHGAEKNIKLNATARMAEIAFCDWLGLDSDAALDWTDKPDIGFDCLAGEQRVDVKHTMRGNCLIWPIRKNHIFATKKFDVFVLVVGDWRAFYISGWCWKQHFDLYHSVADEAHRLDSGTWYIKKDELNQMQYFDRMVCDHTDQPTIKYGP